MATAREREPATPLGTALDLFRIRQAFNLIVRGRDLVEGVGLDAMFLARVARALLPLPAGAAGQAASPFTEPAGRGIPPIDGRVAVVTTGGSGALAGLVGVVRALEESHTRVDVYSVCSGASIFGFPLAAGLSAEEVATLTLSLRTADYVDVGWREIAGAVATLGRGWGGLLRGDRIEEFFRRHLGDRRLGDLAVPAYAPIWNIETNRVDYIGPRTHPDLPVARAIRMAISLPLFVQPAVLDGGSWCDGGVVDIFPVHPVLDIEPPVDVAIAVNGFYPTDFAGEDEAGWERHRASIVRIASQVRMCQHLALAQENLARLRAATEVVRVDPVPYWKVRGTGFYDQWVDSREWPRFMRAGREHMLDALRRRSAVRVRAAQRA